MWEREEGFSQEMRKNRFSQPPIKMENIISWSEYNSKILPVSGIGRDRPPVNFAMNNIVACWSGSCKRIDFDIGLVL